MHKKIRKIAVYRSLIPYLVPELQSFEDTEIKAKRADTKQGNQLKLIKINQNLSKSVTSHTLLVDLMNNLTNQYSEITY